MDMEEDSVNWQNNYILCLGRHGAQHEKTGAQEMEEALRIHRNLGESFEHPQGSLS